MNDNTALILTEREYRLADMISKLDNNSLFALECFLAGSRAGAMAAEKLKEPAADKAEMRA